jgi:hypothetical protein
MRAGADILNCLTAINSFAVNKFDEQNEDFYVAYGGAGIWTGTFG